MKKLTPKKLHTQKIDILKLRVGRSGADWHGRGGLFGTSTISHTVQIRRGKGTRSIVSGNNKRNLSVGRAQAPGAGRDPTEPTVWGHVRGGKFEIKGPTYELGGSDQILQSM